ncbi:hypothetical protein NQ317_012183 [Molorchus minor]|uniref:C2H2-type domain-containing protein n=1 Tax=Molorchus minor TaxID=1323400 RepID=A0ABQ9K2S6_9CUCU|nr:hypothetical protein NQ317_012183 [Molorchus minor]
MEESFGLTWEDSTTVVQTEEVICGIENEILPAETEEFAGVQETVSEELVQEVPENGQGDVPVERIMYLTDGNVLVMQEATEPAYQDQLMECQVWRRLSPNNGVRVVQKKLVSFVGSEEAVGEMAGPSQEDCEIPLPTAQDEYTAARPYPCDFCSRRFRKKANLMNHMVAHQTDRPHGCNLCGVRYIRKCDLMNHLKIHAYIPEGDGLEEEAQQLDDSMGLEKVRKRGKPGPKRRRKGKIKEEREFEETYEDDTGASSSRHYNYVTEDIKMMEHEHVKSDYSEYLPEEEPAEVRYPITDPKKPFVCQHCGVGFAREKAMLSHTRVHAEGDSPFECQKCGEMFWDPAQMREHAKLKHGDIDDIEDDEDEDYSDEETKYGTFYCTTCGISFHRQDNLKRHTRIHVKEEFINEHEFGHICNVCGESFQEALDLLAHAKVHARALEHRCMICGESAADENGVAAHVQLKHSNNLPPNTCMLCGRACKDRRTLLKHSWEHSKEKMFACSKCAKTFHSKARLKRHMLSHRNKAVTCDVCGEDFPDGRSLMNHRHSHSSVSGKQFPCRECGKTFGSRSSQQIHIRIHTGERPYGCRFCWKAFADGGTLRKHERIHTGEKPYACAVCPRAFNQRVVLREHIRSHHSGPDPKYTHSMTPYCCLVCSDMFATSQDLILHLIHHCDMNTALKRQPQVGPRKHKRRRKLKPHELELISNQIEEDENEQMEEEETYSEIDDERERRKRSTRRPPKKPLCSSAIENINSIVNSKVTPAKAKPKKLKLDQSLPSRPKMIHTQKTRIPVETGEDGKVRHKTKTLITRTQPAEIKSATVIITLSDEYREKEYDPEQRTSATTYYRPRSCRLQTFPESSEKDTQQAVDNLLKDEQIAEGEEASDLHPSNGFEYMEQVDHPPEVAAEQTVETDLPVPVNLVEVKKRTRSTSNSLKPGRHVIGPGSKVRLVKEGMIVSKVKNKKQEEEPESILPDVINPTVVVKEEIVHHPIVAVNVKQEIMDPSPLHELAEISMQHASANAQNLFKCEMCSEVFSDRAQLLVHVPIHI